MREHPSSGNAPANAGKPTCIVNIDLQAKKPVQNSDWIIFLRREKFQNAKEPPADEMPLENDAPVLREIGQQKRKI